MIWLSCGNSHLYIGTEHRGTRVHRSKDTRIILLYIMILTHRRYTIAIVVQARVYR